MPENTATPPAGHWRLQTWLRINSSARPGIHRQVSGAAEIADLRYWLEILFAAGIATFGLVENSPAVVIGAMLISPLMGPIMATGLALAIGDLYLGMKSVLKLVASIAISIGLAAFLVWLLPFHSATSEIIDRTNPNLLDLGIALFSGLAGSVAVCRASGDGGAVLPGVAIAVALMPPLCTMGFGLGSGLNLEIAGGAGLLFLTNLVAIVASAFVVFLLVGMNTPEVRQAIKASSVNEGPPRISLRWRILMVVIILGAIAVPLRKALLQVAGETVARSAVQEEVKRLAPADTVLSQQTTVSPHEIAIRLISTQRIPDSKIAYARAQLMRRTGRNIVFTIETVASRSELAVLTERLSHPAPLNPPAKTVAELEKNLMDIVRPALMEIWPSSDAPIQSFDIALGDAGPRLDVDYQAAADLGPAPLDMVSRSLQTTLAMPNLVLNAKRVIPALPGRGGRAAPHDGRGR